MKIVFLHKASKEESEAYLKEKLEASQSSGNGIASGSAELFMQGFAELFEAITSNFSLVTSAEDQIGEFLETLTFCYQASDTTYEELPVEMLASRLTGWAQGQEIGTLTEVFVVSGTSEQKGKIEGLAAAANIEVMSKTFYSVGGGTDTPPGGTNFGFSL